MEKTKRIYELGRAALPRPMAKVLEGEGIELFAPIPLSDCEITRGYLLEREGIERENGCTVMLAVPYYVRDEGERNISLYAVSRDYHLYFAELFGRVIPLLREAFEGHRFVGFADKSPIAEADAAARAGLGVIGRNGLLITEKYSSLVFLGEIITDLAIDCAAGERCGCENCGACIAACPAGGDMSRCLSALTQKKGELSAEEKNFIIEHGSAWGCDVCQLVCPHTRAALSAKNGASAAFFHKNRTPFLTRALLDGMSDTEFAERAFSWRGRGVISRNLDILYGEPGGDDNGKAFGDSEREREAEKGKSAASKGK